MSAGIGQGRVTQNLQGAPVDYALLIKDSEAVEMVWYVNLQCMVIHGVFVPCHTHSFLHACSMKFEQIFTLQAMNMQGLGTRLAFLSLTLMQMDGY